MKRTAFSAALVWVLVSLSAGPSSAAGNGRIVGQVLDQTNALALPTAPVEVVGSETLVHTDLDGKFAIDLAPGRYQLKVAFSGYGEATTREVQVVEGRSVRVDVVLTPESLGFSEELTVTGQLEASSTEASQLLIRKKAGAISDNVGGEEMKKNGDSDASDAMTRVTGVSVVDNQYVFVRGLGERYSNTTLNGAVLPTTEPDKRVVPLDLFPTGLIESIQVVKSYLPDKPADFSGGLVEIEPLAFPQQRTLSFSYAAGIDGPTTFKDTLGYAGGGRDWLGFDDGTRSMPGIIPGDRLAPRGQFTGRGFTPDELASFGRSFSNVWNTRASSARPKQSLSGLYGDSWGRLGAVVSLSYDHRTHQQAERQTYYRTTSGELTPFSDYDFDIATTKTTLGGVANLALQISPNHRLGFSNFYTHNSKDETRSFEGFNSDIRTTIRNARLLWIEEQVLSSRLSGDHYLPALLNSRLDWRLIYSQADREEPDLRETLYEFDSFRQSFVLADESQSGLRMFNDLQDRVYQAEADWSFFFNQWGGLPVMLKFGPALTYRERDFSSRRFRFEPRDTTGLDLSLPAEQLFAPENIGPAFQLLEETRATDAYGAEQNIAAGYAMLDFPLGSAWRLVGGARVESSRQEVNTFDLFNPGGARVRSELDNTDVLPGLNLIHTLSNDMNVRLGYSHTVNRPEFRELAPFEFTDIVGGRAVVGNPALERALIRNVDLRWEWFPSPREVIAVSAFYKDFDQPIERVVEPTAQLRTSYDNAKGASNRGVELELRRELGELLAVSANYTFVDSKIELERTAGQVQTSLERPLSGQSRNLVNGILELRVPGWDLGGRVLYNFFADRIVDVGSLGLPDIVEEGRGKLDAVLSKRFGRFGVRLNAENLTDAEVRFSQAELPQRVYRFGRSVSLGVSYAFH